MKPGDIVNPDILVFKQFLKEAQKTDKPLYLLKLKKSQKEPVIYLDEKKILLPDKSLNPRYHLSTDEAISALEKGFNIGIYGTTDGFCILDFDLKNGKFVIPEEMIHVLIWSLDTFTIKTRSGGYQLYFITDGQTGNPHIYFDNRDAGECRRDRQYVVCPGCYVPREAGNKGHTDDATGYYSVVHDAPIRQFDQQALPEWLKFEKDIPTEPEPDTEMPQEVDEFDDDQILDIAFNAKNGKKLKKLFNGNTKDYNSQSEADSALCCALAFYTKDCNQIIRLMKRSKMWDEKWERDDYQKATVEKALRIVKAQYTPPSQISGPEGPEADSQIITRAQQEIETGDPYNFILNIFKELHVGDEGVGGFLLAAIGCQLCSNTKGLQPGLTGDSGKGKSDACKKMFHLIPAEYKKSGIFSDQALFRMQEKQPGTTFLFDDAANITDYLQQVFKLASSDFQKGLIKTVTGNTGDKKTVELQIPPRCNFWITSVAAEYDEQILSRQLNLHVDDSVNQDKRVADKELEYARYAWDDEPENEDVWICRQIIRLLRARPLVRVKIPYAKRIKWMDFKNRRNLPFFIDIIRSFAALKQYQRETDEDGVLLANEDDFKRAKDLWGKISKEQSAQLNKNEMAALQVFLEKSKDGKVEISRPDLQRLLKFTSGKLARVMDGRRQPDGTYTGGLCNKIPELTKEDILSSEESEVRKKKIVVYAYIGPNNLLELFENVVSLEQNEVEYTYE